MDFYNIPIGFGLALSANAAAMNYYAHLPEEQKQEILGKAHSARSEKEMYTLVALSPTVRYNKQKSKSAI